MSERAPWSVPAPEVAATVAAFRAHRIVSLWDMLRKYAHIYLEWNETTVWWQLAMGEDGDLTKDWDEHQETAIGEGFRAELQAKFDQFIERLGYADLDMTRTAAVRMRSHLSAETTYRLITASIIEIDGRLRDELADRRFLYVSNKVVPYYESPFEGWDGVREVFPDAEYDITEAGKCFALGCHTACVLHLMRVLEIGLRRMAKRFGVSVADKAWHNVITGIQARINAIDSGDTSRARRKSREGKLRQGTPAHGAPRTDKEKKADERAARRTKAALHFYSLAATQFRFFKEAVRNYAMHARTTYGEDQARTIYDAVRAFMVSLAVAPDARRTLFTRRQTPASRGRSKCYARPASKPTSRARAGRGMRIPSLQCGSTASSPTASARLPSHSRRGSRCGRCAGRGASSTASRWDRRGSWSFILSAARRTHDAADGAAR
ncbi:MAG: hypothetical protein WKG32_13170 [Gemmatimonadaceae bacterium]